MNSGSSAFMCSHGHSEVTTAAAVVVIDVAHRIHLDLGAGAAHDDDVIDAADLGDRGVGVGLERNLAAAADALVGGDDDVRLAVLDAAGERIRREAAEHHRMDRADARAGEHGVGRLRDHRHVDGDAVALRDVAVAQDVGHPAHLVVQLLIGDLLVVLGIVAFPDDRDLVGALGQMAVDAVVGDVGDAVLVPLDRDVAGIVDVLDLGRRPVPVDALGLVLPEPFGSAIERWYISTVARRRRRRRASANRPERRRSCRTSLPPTRRKVFARKRSSLCRHYATALQAATRPRIMRPSAGPRLGPGSATDAAFWPLGRRRRMRLDGWPSAEYSP